MSLFRLPLDFARRLDSRRAVRLRRHDRRLAIERCEPRAMLAAQILQVSSTIPAGTAVGIGQTIPFQVLYSEPVSVLGSPVANVNVIKAGGAQAIATYSGSSGGGLIQNFSYSVAVGDSVSQFDVPLTVPFLIGGTITTVSTGLADDADRTVLVADPTIADMQPGLSVDGIAPVVPTVAPAVYVNPTVWQAGAWATLHPNYFVISGTAGTGPLATGEVLTVTINGATYRATSTSSGGPGSFFVDGTGAWKVYIRSVGTNVATIPYSGILAPWSTTNTDTYNVVATLTDAAGNSSTDGTVAEVTIDTVAPTLTAVNSTSTGGPDTLPGSYGVGSVLDFYVVYNEPIRVVGTPLLPINVLPGPAFATFVGVVNGNEAHFQYTVQPGDSSPGVNVTGTAISLNGGFIEDLAANAAPLAPPTTAPANTVTGILIDTVTPTVSNVTATNANGTYVVGSPTITITVTFDQVVFVTPAGGVPLLALNSAAGRTATYAGGSGTNTLSFSYTVLPGDDTPDLDYTAITALSLNGAAIKDAAGNAAVLTLAVPGTAGSLGANKAIVVAAQPKVIQVSSPDLAGVYTAGQTVRIRVMFDKVVAVAAGPSPTLSLGTTPASNATWSNAGSGGYIDGAGAQTTTPTNILQFNYLVKPGDTTSGAPLNYVSILSLAPGAGINLSPAPVSPPGVLAANLQLPPLIDALNILPGAGIVIAPDTTAPLAPAIGLAVDTTNFIGNYATDGITNNTTISVTGLEPLPNTTWQYRYKLGGSGPFTTWLTGGPIVSGVSSFVIPGSFTYGPGSIEVRQTDWTGNVGAVVTNVAPSWNFDVTPPTPPVSATIPETGAAGSGVTNIPTVTVTGLEPGALLQYNANYDSRTGTVATGSTWISVAPATGTTSFPGGSATFILAPGTYDPTNGTPGNGTGVVVRQQDLAGNVQAGAPWTQLTTSSGGTTIIIRLDVTVATPTAGLAADTTPGFSPYTGTPYTTDGFTSNGLVNVSGLEVQNLAASPPVSGIATWEYSTNSGGTWTVGGTTAPTGTFTLLDNAGLPGGTVYTAGTVRVRQTDLAGNVSTAWQNTNAWTIDQTAPAIQNVTAAAGTYSAGQTVAIAVNFGESIYLSSNAPTLTLNTGATASLVTPVVVGATGLQFSYTVRPGDAAASLQVTAFKLNGATLADKAGNLPTVPLVGAPVTVAPGTVVINAAIRATFSVGSTTPPGPAIRAWVPSMQIVFNTPVRNFTLAALRLFWNPDANGTPSRNMSLAGASIRMVGNSGTTYTLTLPKAATSAKGAYMLVLDGTRSNIRSTLNPAAAMTSPSSTYFRRV